MPCGFKKGTCRYVCNRSSPVVIQSTPQLAAAVHSARASPLAKSTVPPSLRLWSPPVLPLWPCSSPKNIMPNSCYTADSHCSSAQTIRLQERDIMLPWAITRQVSRGLPSAPLRRDYRVAVVRQLPKGHPASSPLWGFAISALSRSVKASPSCSQTPYRASRYSAVSSKPPRPGSHNVRSVDLRCF